MRYWKNQKCVFCQEPIKHSFELKKEAGKSAWLVHQDCHKRLDQLRSKFTGYDREKVWKEFNRFVTRLEDGRLISIEI